MTAGALQQLLPQAPQRLRDILEPARGPIAPPIRSEIFGLERFAQHGHSLAETHRAVRATSDTVSFSPRLRSNIRSLREAHRYIGLQAATGYDISPAAEWLLDNFHLIEAQLKEVHEGMPLRYFRALPILVDPPLAGLPRIYGVAWAFVAHTDGAFDEDLLIRFLRAYQERRELRLSELWALPTTLRVVLIENLRRLAERVATNKAARAVANLCCDQIATCSVATLQSLLELLNLRGVGQVFLAQMALRLQDGSGADADADGVYPWLRHNLPEPARTQAQHSADQAADNLSVSNAVKSLRSIGDADWSEIVASTSALMQLMLSSALFAAEHANTRDQTLHGIERLARRSGRSESAVAHSLLALMQPPAGRAEPTGANHWLSGPGRGTMAQALGLPAPARLPWQSWARHAALGGYLGALLLGTTGLVAWILLQHNAGWMGGSTALWLDLLAAGLMLFPASEAVIAVVNRLICESARPSHLPRLALANGIGPEHRVMVAIPAMLVHADSARQLTHRLLLHYLANPEPQAQFALLTDWADADSAETATDAALLSDAVDRIAALNARYPPAADAMPRFLLLHRTRQFSQTEQRWIGWERKRGKLELLVRALASGDAAGFSDLGAQSQIATDTRYILTLDSDTQLPPGRLRELVGVAAHPQNQPQLDASGRCVVAGYGILQPRVVTPLPAPAEFTPYHWLFAGQCGIDPYSAATSEVYQDLFQEGSFTGKGLLHVATMQAVLGDRLPSESVLSHDLLEGSLARCATVTDVTLIEDAPFHADVAASRVHRWARGDWQLLPFLLQPGRYPLRAINRWKMFDNLRRSLVAPMSLALLALALGSAVILPWVALALVAAAFSAGPLMGAVTGFAPQRDDVAKRHFFQHALAELGRAVSAGLWLLAQLLQQSLSHLDAIGRVLYRMAVSRRHLLQWTTAAAAQAGARTGLLALLRLHWAEPALALLLLGMLLLLGSPNPWLATSLCLVWAASPLWTWWVSRPHAALEESIVPLADRNYLEGVARDTWRLFERCIGPGDNHLPPDNLQTMPFDMVAHRTSPTNIGLYLLSVACAREFGWIGTQDLLQRLEASLATLDRMQRHRGHFLNWYDTTTLAPLLPMYVSTVDSGNLSGHLLTLAQACLALADQPPDPGSPQQAAAPDSLRLQAVAERCEALAWAADYRFLYHRKRHLFHIGYRVAEQQLDPSFYDLLASESRLTSLLAIAKGDVPVRHWASLGRPFYAIGAEAGLRSWSGSMFEYLMPSLVLHEPHGSVLQEAGHAAVHEQILYAASQGVPWGISESAYAGRDDTLAYQYAPQGVPRLALRRTPPDELVVAPYATALAAQLMPRRAKRNLLALEQMAARGPYGFIEALDFSPSRQAEGAVATPVGTYMAHHQGMTIVALANVLLDGVARRWGMANPSIEAVSSLLHERAPREISQLHAPLSGPQPQALEQRGPGLLRELAPGAAALEPTHVLSNGRYAVTLRPNGAGWSRWGDIGINRWRDDALRDACGSFLYLRWDQQPRPVSITQHPAPDPAAHYQCLYHADRVCFDARWPALQAHTTVWVSPEDDVEFRQVELLNLGERTLDIELISAFALSLTDARADEAHPAFTNLFVRAHWQPAQQALVFARTPRLPTEPAVQAAHFLADGDPQMLAVRVETDRHKWLGRNRDASNPVAAVQGVSTDSTQAVTPLDTGLDPVCALAVRLRIAPHGKAKLTFATAASDNAATLTAVIDKYRQPSHVARSSLMSATLAGIRLRAQRISADNHAAIQSLTSALVLSLTRPRVRDARLEATAGGACDRRTLWRLGISGDRPLVLLIASTPQAMGLLRVMTQALRLWCWGGIGCDLVVLNAEGASYLMPLQREVGLLRERHLAECPAKPGPSGTAFHLLRLEELSAEELATLHGLARLQLVADGRPLSHHVQDWIEFHERDCEQRHAISTAAVVSTYPGSDPVPAPTGAFDAATGEFRFEVGARLRPLRPWVNVLSNPEFGAQLSEAGGGYTWAINSRMNQLTAWSNDPVTDPPAEWFLLQDQRNRQVWNVAPSSPPDERLVYQVSHGQGHSVIQHRRDDLDVAVSWCVDAQTSVKQIRLRLINRGHRSRQLRVIGIAEWLMGAVRSDRNTVVTASHRLPLAVDPGAPARELTVLLCTQLDRAGGLGDGSAFLAVAGDAEAGVDWTCDRRECFDARGQMVLPDHLGQRSGAGLDPCAMLALPAVLGAGDTVERVFLLGYGSSPAAALQLALAAAAIPARQRMSMVAATWDRLLGATRVRTPDPLFDAMVNRWLLYQTVACRLWAKAGFYQAGGATGYRDQLQDTMALAWAAPAMLRQQIVVCASRQFVEGDVQHWWHAPGGAGVRTHFSDDLLWLPHACVHYLRATGDNALLEQQVAFLEGVAIAPGAEDAYYTPHTSTQTASVFEHCARAIDRSLAVGAHGLPLMGSGDWNDGMNRVGIEGRGESVWLGWFLCRLVADFAPLAQARGEPARALRWEQAAAGWKDALLNAAWDGQWFKRAFFDDGQALGSHSNPEARIDLIAQAWSVLSEQAPLDMQRKAMAAVEQHLVDHEASLVRLLDPPLAHALPSAGYIQAYPPGVRENGGQYAHAGVWALMAQAALAHTQAAAQDAGNLPYRYFTCLSPAHRALHPHYGAVYGIEPYVMAGDVYSQPPYVGRGGWSWYTGAAAWLQRAAIESIMGLRLDASTLQLQPCLPAHWPRAELTLEREGRTMHFILFRGDDQTALAATAQLGAQLLRPLALLAWADLPQRSCFVIPLPSGVDAGTQQAAAAAPVAA